MDVLGGLLLWPGVLGVVAATVLAFRRWRVALKLFAAAVLLFVTGVLLPVRETRVTPRARIDEFAPVYQFGEFHEIRVAASRERVDAAIRSVSADEIRYYRTLTWLRRVAKPGYGVLNPPPGQPILRTFTSGPFPLRVDEPGRELVMVAESRKAQALVRIAFNFRIEEEGATHCRVTTETRVYASGPHMVRGFGAYWRMIYPGSALIRREWLKAIQRRAEAETGHIVRP